MHHHEMSTSRHESSVLLPFVVLLLATACFTAACFATAEGRDAKGREVAGEKVDETPHATHADEAEAMQRLLQIERGDTVADVGAGDGDWTDDLAEFVGTNGTVWATEVDEDLIDDLNGLAEDLPQIRPVLGDENRTGLEENCCDAILLRLVYHHFTDPAPMRADLRSAMKPGARLLVVDITPQSGWNDLDGVPDRGGHGIPTDRLIEEMEADGFRVVERLDAWGDEEDEFAVVFVESGQSE